MSKIDDLIKQYCPNGVEYKTIEEVCVPLKKGTLKQTELVEGGIYPVINSGRDLYGYYSNYNNEGPAITIASRGEYAGFITYMECKFWAGGLCYPYSVKEHSILPKYLFYFLKYKERYIMDTLVARGGIPALNKTDMDKFKVAIPPLPVQEEIVKVLDAFTALEAELEAELEARKKQYEYYRNKLLTFNENTTGGGRIKFMQLGEVCNKVSTIKWKNNQDKEYKYIDLSSLNRNNNTIEDAMVITNDNAPSRAQQIVKKDDVLFGTTRPTLRRYCIIPNEYDNQICSTGYCVLRADTNIIIPQYLFFMLTTNSFYNYVEEKQSGASYPSISDTLIKKYIIPVPPLEEQERIVAILDKFDSLVNDISEGLPAELTARRQQYEYYRNKLLTFDEAA